ncbi:MAG TPA: hypothetical protein VF903_06475 [Nitrospirota bacterium]
MSGLGRVRQWVFIVLPFLLLFSSGSAIAAPLGGEAEVYVAAENFEWREFDDAGNRLLRESGPRYGVGFTYYHEFLNQATVKPRVELFGGTVDYDGATQAGVPVKTRTDYFGVKIEGDAGYTFRPSQGVSIEPFGGLGLRGWSRNIKNGTASNGTTAYGYREDWSTFYLRLGVRGSAAMSAGGKLFAETGVKFPLYNENYVSQLGITLNPGNEPSLFAEAGIEIHFFKISGYYDSMRFSKSDVVYSGASGYFQPKSHADMVGVRIGYSF